MRKICSILCAFAVILLFSGCSLLFDESIGNNIGRFVDPMQHPSTDHIPATNAVPPSALPEPEKEEPTEDADPGALPDNWTFDPLLEEDFYIGDGFKFYVPFLWRGNMAVEKLIRTEEGYEIPAYHFYYRTDPETVGAKLMTIEVLPYDYYNRFGSGDGVLAATTIRNEPVFILKGHDEALPADFTDVDAFLEVYAALNDKWDFSRLEDGESAE